MAYAQPSDVTARYDGPADEARIRTVLDNAETVLLLRLPGLTERVEDSDTLRDAVAMVETSMTIRALTAPPGPGYSTQTAGPFSGTIDAIYRGYLRPSVDELALLGGGDRAGRAFTIVPANEPETVESAPLWRWFDYPDGDEDIAGWA